MSEPLDDIRETLAEIKTGLALINQTLATHTESDSQNFESLARSLNEVRDEVKAVQLERAEERGASVAASKAGRSAGGLWGAGAGATLIGLIEFVRALLGT